MLMRKLGRTGYSVTALGLGCYQLTGQFGVSPQLADSIIDTAYKLGINYLDTAQQYGAGESEAIIGRALTAHPDWRPYISDKCGHFDYTISRFHGEESYTDPEEIIRSIKHSLWLLRLDHIHILMLHEHNSPLWKFNYETGSCIGMEVLRQLKREGVTEYIGIGGWDCHLAAKLVSRAEIDVVLMAGGINLLSRPMFDEFIPEAVKHNVGVIVGGAFGQNNKYLIRKDRSGVEELRNSDDLKQAVMAEKLTKLYDLSDELGTSMTELAVRYVLSFNEIHCHVAGAREAEHLLSNSAAVDKGSLSPDVMEQIDRIQNIGESPTPLDVALQSKKQ